MKGIVFTLLNEIIEENFGYETWDQVLDRSDIKSGGIYTSSANYPDSELFELVSSLSNITHLSKNELITTFGYHSLKKFHCLFPKFFEASSAKEFLKGIHCIVHVQVKKLYSDAQTPTFVYEDPGKNKLIMKYRSPRKLCSSQPALSTQLENILILILTIIIPNACIKGTITVALN